MGYETEIREFRLFTRLSNLLPPYFQSTKSVSKKNRGWKPLPRRLEIVWENMWERLPAAINTQPATWQTGVGPKAPIKTGKG
jgi:hypothetical protein